MGSYGVGCGTIMGSHTESSGALQHPCYPKSRLVAYSGIALSQNDLPHLNNFRIECEDSLSQPFHESIDTWV